MELLKPVELAGTCETCDLPIPARPHQARRVRACSPHCAKALFAKENPYHYEHHSLRGLPS